MKLIVKCAWCGRIMGIKEIEEEEAPPLPITHSICNSCLRSLHKQTQETINNSKHHNNKRR
ncbi:hypothetical protein DRN85_10475 [Methanosarcinales archaeon]|nr:MAG: hypothetical protein DRN85_10475 [Methanosarcinales archaeon]